MKKSELKALTDYLGELPMGKIEDTAIRRAVIRLYCRLSAINRPVAESIETLRLSVIGDKQKDVITYLNLVQAGDEASLKKAAEMTECVQIEKDYEVMLGEILRQDVPADADIPTIPLDTLYTALADCGFPRMPKDVGPAAIEAEFRSIIE